VNDTTNTQNEMTRDKAESMLRMLYRIRMFEEQMLDFLATGVIKGGSHIYIGQEAVATGVCAALNSDDYITSTHRGHGHGLAKGGESKLLMAEILGRATGVCRGRGGSLHLADVDTGNLGANGIVGGSIAIASGAALSAQMRNSGQVVACFFGDGAISTGIFHESMNMAQVWNLPVLFICENNLYAMSVSTQRAHGLDDLAQRASGYGMRSDIVDGQDAVAVYEATLRHAEEARQGKGPTFIECKTYRYGGHSRSDARKYRTRDEERQWRDRDPLDVFGEYVQASGLLNEDEVAQVSAEVAAEIKEAAQFAQDSPQPAVEELYTHLWAATSA
jgi:TPP-dependent pyruvate/acetoin dehydrogenase alpha subunit